MWLKLTDLEAYFIPTAAHK